MPIPYKQPWTRPDPPPVAVPAKKKSSRPRKRRTQTMAEKGTEPATLYHWQELLDSYVFAPAPNVNANLTERDGSWTMVVDIDSKHYVGSRPTLEEAFKATDRFLYLHARTFWLRSICHAVIAPWCSELEGL